MLVPKSLWDSKKNIRRIVVGVKSKRLAMLTMAWMKWIEQQREWMASYPLPTHTVIPTGIKKNPATSKRMGGIIKHSSNRFKQFYPS